MQSKKLNTPKQFPWETPPFVGPPSPSQSLLKSITGLGKTSVEPKTTGTYYNRGTFANKFRTSLAKEAPGLSNRYFNNPNISSPKTLNTINNFKPIWQNGNVIKGSTSTSLATRGAVGLAITKYGGGGGGEFSK